MSRNGSGTYTLPAGNPVVTNTTISSTWANTTLSDIASALTGSVASDGQTSMAGNLNMAYNKIVSVTDPTNPQDATTKAYVDAADAVLTAAITALLPTGSINMWSTSTAPTGYLLCNGAGISTTTYAALFAVIGYNFGGSAGTFNLPNYIDRMPIGSGNLYGMGNTGGSKDAVVVSHTHTITDAGHAHTIPISNPSAGGAAGTGVAGLGSGYQTGSNVTGISINSTGSSGTNANLPPYIGIQFIIKV